VGVVRVSFGKGRHPLLAWSDQDEPDRAPAVAEGRFLEASRSAVFGDHKHIFSYEVPHN
jgi:hypothetical protein